MTNLRREQAHQDGFTLVELLVVLSILGILVAIGAPSYLGFLNLANQMAADADVRAAVPAAEAYYSNTGSYTLLDLSALRAIDVGATQIDHVVVVDSQTYCLDRSVGGAKAKATRGKNQVSSGNILEGSLC